MGRNWYQACVYAPVLLQKGTNAFMIACEDGHVHVAEWLLKNCAVNIELRSRVSVCMCMWMCLDACSFACVYVGVYSCVCLCMHGSLRGLSVCALVKRLLVAVCMSLL